MFSKASILIALAAAASAVPWGPSPAPAPAPSPSTYYHWTVTNWNAGNARGGYYDFDVSGPVDPLVPQKQPFTAHCNGDAPEVGQQVWTACLITDVGYQQRYVYAHLLQQPDGYPPKIEISYQYTDFSATTDPKPYYVLIGQATATWNAFNSPLQTFDVVPQSLLG